MKKIFTLLLALAMCLSLFAGCAGEANNGPSLQDAVNMLEDYYRADDGKQTPADYKVAAQLPIGDVKFDVTWTVSLDTIKIVLEDGLYTVKVPVKNDAEVEYTLTATVKDATGKTETKEYKRVLPVYDNSAAVTEPVEGEAYKMYFVQASVGKTLFCIGEAQNNKFIKTDVDPKKGNDFFAEKVDGGYKFYTTINGAKMYLHAHTTTDDAGKVSKFLSFEAESDAVYYYKAEVKTWMVMIDNFEYGVGTYGTFETMSLSEGTYFTAESAGTTQFCMALMAKDAAEALSPSEGPADPTELTSISDFTEIALKLEDKGNGTTEKYLVKGTIVEIKSEEYGNMYIEDAEGNRLYVYGVYSKDGADRYDAMNPQPKVGDTVTLMGIACNYNGAQMKNGWLQELIPGSTTTPEQPEQPENPGTDMTMAEIVDAAYALAPGAKMEGKHTLTGKIISVDTEWSDQYKNITVTIVVDGKEDKPIQAFRLKGEGAESLKVGDVITVTGTLMNYLKEGATEGKIEFDAGCTLGSGSTTTPEQPEDKPNPPASSVEGLKDVTELKENTEYYIESLMGTGSLFFDGGDNGKGRITGTNNVAEAKAVKLESAGAAGEYYIYFDNNGTKTYIAAPGEKTSAFALQTTADEACVWIIDVEAKTIISKKMGTRGIATQTAETKYNTFSTYATSNFGTDEYDVAWLMEKA